MIDSFGPDAPDGFERCYSSVVSVGRKLHIQMVLQRNSVGNREIREMSELVGS